MLVGAVSPNILPTQTVSAGVNVCTWTGDGADDNWSTEANWDCDNGTVPADGYELVFPASASVDGFIRNDLSSSNVYTGIEFTGDLDVTCGSNPFASWMITSPNANTDPMRIAGDIIVSTTGEGCGFSNYQFQMPIIFESDALVSFPIDARESIGGISLAVTSGNYIDVQDHTLTIDGRMLNLTSPFVGSGEVVFDTGSEFWDINAHLISGSNDAFTGDITIGENIGLSTYPIFFSNSGGSTTFSDGSRLSLYACDEDDELDLSRNINHDLIFGDATVRFNGDGGLRCHPDEPDEDEFWRKEFLPGWNIDISGDVTLTDDVVFEVGAESVSITGDLNGSGRQIQLQDLSYGGSLIVGATINDTDTPNGVYESEMRDFTITDNQPGVSLYIGAGWKIFLEGERGDTRLQHGGTLAGAGSVGNILSLGGIIEPGLSPGVLSTGSLDFDSDTVLDIEIGGTALGEYDQLDVTGTVSLGGATLNTSFWDGFVPSQDDAFIIIQNDGTDAVTGTFDGLAEGATFVLGDVTFSISYVGGTGNDVVLTVTDAPGPPETGFMTLQASTLLPMVAIASGIGILGIRRIRTKFTTK